MNPAVSLVRTYLKLNGYFTSTEIPVIKKGNDGLFFEVHPDPDRAPSDGPNMIRLADFGEIIDGVLAVHRTVRGEGAP